MYFCAKPFPLMYTFLVTIIIILFVGVLFVNIFFRVRVFKIYKRLVQNKVDFGSVHFFNTKRMEEEILPKYPEHREDILEFVRNIKFSLRLGVMLIGLITIFGGILMWYRYDY